MQFEAPSDQGFVDVGQTGANEALLRAKMPGTGLVDQEPLSFDPRALRANRLAKLRGMMRDTGYAALILLDPYNQRYATGSRNMFGYFLRNSTRYFFVPVEGPVILFEYPQSAHVSSVLETVDEVRKSKIVWSSVRSKDDETARPFADEIADLVKRYGRGETRVGLDRCFMSMATALEGSGLEVRDCQQDILRTRAVKTPEEVACLRLSMVNAEAAVHQVRQHIRPGISEQELFAKMYESVIAGGGELIETRLLSSGTRTNPWFNEASTKRLRAGDLVALDTDTIGNFGYYSDFSRTFFCGPGRPSPRQKDLHRLAYEQVQTNIELIKPGVSYREIAEKAWNIPERFFDQRYTSVMHGCGMHGESPFIAHAADFDQYGSDGVLEPGMVLCVESYIGEPGGPDGVKLEEQVLVTENGGEVMSGYPLDEQLLET